MTDPAKRDTDRDGIKDGLEDEDGDRLSNLGEQRYRTDPTDPDSDGDGVRDGVEDYNGNGKSNAAEQDTRPVPAGLSPDPSEAFWDVPESYGNGCHTGAHSAVIQPCQYGASKAAVRVALWGDSHALQWLPALDKAGRQEGWAVTALTKTACPSVEVTFSGAAYDDAAVPCRRWRVSALQWLAENPHDVVIITNAGRYPLTDETGERVYGEDKEPVWQAGLERVLAGLPDADPGGGAGRHAQPAAQPGLLPGPGRRHRSPPAPRVEGRPSCPSTMRPSRPRQRRTGPSSPA